MSRSCPLGCLLPCNVNPRPHLILFGMERLATFIFQLPFLSPSAAQAFTNSHIAKEHMDRDRKSLADIKQLRLEVQPKVGRRGSSLRSLTPGDLPYRLQADHHLWLRDYERAEGQIDEGARFSTSPAFSLQSHHHQPLSSISVFSENWIHSRCVSTSIL